MPVTRNCAAVCRGGRFLCFHAITGSCMELLYLHEYVEKIYLNVLYFVYSYRKMVFSSPKRCSQLL